MSINNTRNIAHGVASGLNAGPWKLSPSDLTFLWNECQRCFYLKVRLGWQHPQTPMPKIFTEIHTGLKNWSNRMRTEMIAPSMPNGVITFGEKWVRSESLYIPSCTSTCFINGRLDTVASLDTGAFGVIDFKTAKRNEDHVPLYGRQLHAYAIALENPAPGKFALNPIDTLGLLVWEPEGFLSGTQNNISLDGELKWVEISRDDASFYAFLGEVLTVLESPTAPPASPFCDRCRYREKSRTTGL